MDRAKIKVKPESEARNQNAKPAVGVARQIAEAVTFTAGHLIEQLSRLYGYALLIAGIESIFIVCTSSLPLTKWNDEGVPRANVFVVSTLLGIWLSTGLAFFTCFNLGTIPPVLEGRSLHIQPKYVWSGGLAGMAIGGLFLNLGCTALPAGLGLNPRFYMLDALGMLLGGVAGTFFATLLMKLQYQSRPQMLRVSLEEDEGMNNEGADIVSSAEGDRERQKDAKAVTSCGLWIVQSSVSIAMGMLTLAYPLAVLPYYRAETTSDWARFIIVCVVHPLAQE